MIGRLLRSSKNRTGFWGGSRSDGWWWRHCVMVLKFQLGWHRQWGRNPNGRQSHDITIVAKSAIEDIMVAPTSAVYKKLSFGLVCPMCFTSGLWCIVCTRIRNDVHFLDPDVTTATVSILVTIPSYLLVGLISNYNQEISDYLNSPSNNLHFSPSLKPSIASSPVTTSWPSARTMPNLLEWVSAWSETCSTVPTPSQRSPSSSPAPSSKSYAPSIWANSPEQSSSRRRRRWWGVGGEVVEIKISGKLFFFFFCF